MVMMKKRIVFYGIILLLAICSRAIAEPDMLPNEGFEEAYVLQLGDEFSAFSKIRLALIEKGCLEDAVCCTSGHRFCETIFESVIAYQRSLSYLETGMLDPETLRALFETEESEANEDALVYIPIHGGTKYHDNAACSKMEAPRYVYKTDALTLGYTPCGRCHPG